MKKILIKDKRLLFTFSTILGVIIISNIGMINTEAAGIYDAKKIELDTKYGAQKSNDMPVIIRNVDRGDGGTSKQFITLGSSKKEVDAVTGIPGPKPQSMSALLGTGTGANPSSIFLNVFNETKSGTWLSTVLDPYYMSTTREGYAGLTINDTASWADQVNTKLYYNPKETSVYSFKDNKDNDVIKLLSNTKKVYGDTRGPYVVEMTATAKKNSTVVDMDLKVTNDGNSAPMSLLYGMNLELTETAQNGTLKPMNAFLQSLGRSEDKKKYLGAFMESPGEDHQSATRKEIEFPLDSKRPTDVGTSIFSYNNYYGFRQSGGPQQTDSGQWFAGQGFEAGMSDGYASALFGRSSYKDESRNQYPKMAPLPETRDIGIEKNTKAVTFKKFKNANNFRASVMPGEILEVNWCESFSIKKIERTEKAYDLLDNKSKSPDDLSKFDLVDNIPPLKINSSGLGDLTNVENYFMLGAQNKLDTKKTIKAGQNFGMDPSTKNILQKTSDINKNYRTNQAGFSLPRVITFNKNIDNNFITSYSFNYGGLNNPNTVNSNDESYNGSGFGLITTEDGKVVSPSPSNLSSNSRIEEVYVSKDKSRMLIYGMYRLGDGSEIPMKLTMETSNSVGKGRIKFEYVNTKPKPVTFNSFYSIHMDINGIHRSSEMKTLGGSKGISFKENSLPALGTAKGPDGITRNVEYYVGYYTSNSGGKIPRRPSNIIVSELTDSETGFPNAGQSNQLSPPGWSKFGAVPVIPKFDESQPKNETIRRRDANGKVTSAKNVHPSWTFVYDPETINPGEVGRSDIELKVSDIEDISYSAVGIKTEDNKKAVSKSDFNFETIYSQVLDSPLMAEDYRPDYLTITADYDPLIMTLENSNEVKNNFTVMINNGPGKTFVPLGTEFYTASIDNIKRKIIVKLNDKILWDNKDKKNTIQIKQKAVFPDSFTSNEEIVKRYDKTVGAFNINLAGYNEFKMHNLDDPAEIQDPATNTSQKIDYKPDFKVTAKNGLSINKGIDAGEAKNYVDIAYNKIFNFDDIVVSYKDAKPVFSTKGKKIFKVIAESKSFGQPQEIEVTVDVVEDAGMTVKRLITNKDKETNFIRDINTAKNPELKDEKSRVNITENFAAIMKKETDKVFSGYNFSKTVVKLDDGKGTVVTDLSKVPTQDFILEIFYDGLVILNHPDSFDFGSHKLSVFGNSEVRPKISKGTNPEENTTDMQVINTQGKGSGWELYAKQTKKMVNKNITNPTNKELKGEIYYISAVGKSPVIMTGNSQRIEKYGKTADNNDIVNTVSLLPNDLSQKSGIYLDIFAGNSLGNYTDGEITWELRNAP